MAISRTTTDPSSQSSLDPKELSLIKEERLSAQKCLQICAQLSDQIDQVQPKASHDTSLPRATTSAGMPERMFSEGLQQCKKSLNQTSARLESHMVDLMDRLTTKSTTAMASEDDVTDLIRLREEWKTARRCMDICSQAETHLQANVSVIDNYATGDDAIQYLVSTNGQTIHGKNTGYGWRTRQVGGHLSDASIQQISRDSSAVFARRTDSAGSRTSTVDKAKEDESAPEFDRRYGRGSTIASKSD